MTHLAPAALSLILAAAGSPAAAPATPVAPAVRPIPKEIPPVGQKLERTDEEWRALLTPQQYEVLRRAGTERAFTGALWNEHRKGTYSCAGCNAPLFASSHKFESGTGWPSFWQPLEDGRVATRIDKSWFATRVEVHCDRCGGHLGHVFDDGPKPTGKRYCMNSAALAFTPEAEAPAR